jgi:hypothetical protein
MAAELAELRRENTALRRRLEEASHFVHQPYGPSPMLPAATPSATVPPRLRTLCSGHDN